MGRLTACERKWHLTRELGEPDGPKSSALQLGTLMHALIQEHMLRRPWRDEWAKRLADEPGWDETWEPPALFNTAEWLMQRYEKVYAKDPLTTITVEVPFDLPLPGMPEVRVRGYIDGLAYGPDGLVLAEIKTMGKWAKADRAVWEPQVPTYLWAAHQMGLEVKGAVFRAVYTYRYRGKEERPAADSFRDVWVPYDQAQIDAVLDDYRRAARRGQHLIDHPEDAVRNVGEGCNYCPHKRGCVIAPVAPETPF